MRQGQDDRLIYDMKTGHWATVCGRSGQLLTVTSTANDHLTSAAYGKHVIVLVPMTQVVVTSLNLPRLSQHKLRNAIPFALEDTLIDDLETYHYVIIQSANAKDKRTHVAIVAHATMQTWLDHLSTIGLNADQMIPIGYGISYKAERDVETSDASTVSPVVAIRPDNAEVLIRSGEHDVYACDVINLEFVLKSAGHNPSTVSIRNYGAENKQLIGSNCDHLPAGQFLEDISRHIMSSSVNLLEARYTTKGRKSYSKNRFKGVGLALIAFWFLSILIYPLGSYLILKQHAKELELAISDIYKKNFPKSTAIVAPKLRMQEKLNQINSQGGQQQLLLWLANIGDALAQQERIKCQRIDYQNHQLNLRIIATRSEDITLFSEALLQRGLTVKQQNASISGSTLHATLQIS